MASYIAVVPLVKYLQADMWSGGRGYFQAHPLSLLSHFFSVRSRVVLSQTSKESVMQKWQYMLTEISRLLLVNLPFGFVHDTRASKMSVCKYARYIVSYTPVVSGVFYILLGYICIICIW